MAKQKKLDLIEDVLTVKVKMFGCEYKIIQDTLRHSMGKPSWWVQRMNDLKVTERHYNHPDGAFAAVYHERCNWID